MQPSRNLSENQLLESVQVAQDNLEDVTCSLANNPYPIQKGLGVQAVK